jgi:CO/xanthine dehydrogenase Mo-binding subunit
MALTRPLPAYAPVGARIPRIDAAAFATGRAPFATDLGLPGMLHCRLLYADRAPARVTRLDVSEAARLPGVEAVLTAADVPWMPMAGTSISARHLFVKDEVRSVGDVLAAVAAADAETAQRAVELIHAEYEDLPGVYTLEEALAPGATAVHPGKAQYPVASWMRRWFVEAAGNEATHFRMRKGDVAAARARSHVVVHDRLRTQRIEHFSMEPHAAVAVYDAAGDRVTVWCSSGKPFRTQAQLAELLRVPLNRVTIVFAPTGGDFGGKGEVTVEPYCAVLARRTGRPVKFVYTREEEFFAATCKTPFDIDLALGFDRDGRFLFADGELWLDTGAYNSMSAMISVYAAIHLEGPYAVPNVAVRSRCAFTHNTMSGSFRGFGNPQISFARESLVDDAAARLGLDPVEIRLRNAWQAGWANCTGQVLDPSKHGVHVREVVAAAAEASEFHARRRAAHEADGANRPRRLRGVGMALAHHGLGGPALHGRDTGAAFVKANPDGTATLITGAADVGQGIDTALSQIVAEGLGLGRQAIAIASKTTDGVPQDLGASASRTTYFVGNATRAAALDLRRKLIAVAAEMLEADPADLECAEGRVFVRGAPARALAFAELVHYSMRRLGEQPYGVGVHHGETGQLDENGQGDANCTFEYSCQVAEVEVDADTGEVRVVRLLSAQDVGRALNPMIVEGQMEGGMVMGLGFALLEEVVCDGGRVLNPFAFDYRTPRAGDMPELTTVMLEHRDPGGPYGAKGVGEICMNPTAAAIANAVADAIGTRVTSLPITPEKVLAALASLASRAASARTEGD